MSLMRFTMLLACAALPGIAASGCTGAVAARSGAPATPALRFVSFLPAGYQAEFTLRDRRAERSFRSTSFGQDTGEAEPHSPWQPLPDKSRVDVEVTLLDQGNVPLGSGHLSIPQAERDWLYEARVQVIRFSPGVPMVPCMGCFGEARFPVREAAGLTTNDSLVVTWSARHAFHPMPPA